MYSLEVIYASDFYGTEFQNLIKTSFQRNVMLTCVEGEVKFLVQLTSFQLYFQGHRYS